jgi:Uncharacterised nucleotidyltransferase
MKPRDSRLLCALREPATVAEWSPRTCAELLHQARRSGLLGRVAVRVNAACQAAGRTVPPALAGHFDSALRLCRAQRAEVEREARYLRAALQGLDTPIVMLKGAAYVLAQLPAAEGRLFSDIDLLVAKTHLTHAESQLLMNGWMSDPQTAYDEHYYRTWMHELPPMTHVHRRTTLDLHHTLLPETARLRPDATALVEAAQPVAGWPGLYTLCPADMVLHSLTHLFMNDETRHALRDLCDLDALLRHFGKNPEFWPELLQRAQRHQLTRPLFYGLRYARRLLGTPVPAPMDAGLQRAAPPAGLRLLMDMLWLPTLAPAAEGRAGLAQAGARGALYVRGHWLRMPAMMLLRHLTIKAWHRRERAAEPSAQTMG